MKTSPIAFVLILASLLSAPLVAGTQSPGNPRYHKTAHRTPAAASVTPAADNAACPTMTVRKGRFTRQVACTGATAQTAKCRNHCRAVAQGQ